MKLDEPKYTFAGTHRAVPIPSASWHGQERVERSSWQEGQCWSDDHGAAIPEGQLTWPSFAAAPAAFPQGLVGLRPTEAPLRLRHREAGGRGGAWWGGGGRCRRGTQPCPRTPRAALDMCLALQPFSISGARRDARHISSSNAPNPAGREVPGRELLRGGWIHPKLPGVQNRAGAVPLLRELMYVADWERPRETAGFVFCVTGVQGLLQKPSLLTAGTQPQPAEAGREGSLHKFIELLRTKNSRAAGIAARLQGRV